MSHAKTEKAAAQGSNASEKKGIAGRAGSGQMNAVQGIAGTVKKIITQLQVILLVRESRHPGNDRAIDYSGDQEKQQQNNSRHCKRAFG
ncbi:MAG: hypothetical protein LV480_05285 [Methylacidiphilales bacterium]|nr:hypothetical protein [Candidatus Methylacidiphilales bacterium]